MTSPSNPEQKESSKVLHDGMDDAGHEAQKNKGIGGGSIREEDKEEGSPESTKQERSEEKQSESGDESEN
jgi:hypothetical protein